MSALVTADAGASLQAVGLSKRFGGVHAVEGVDMELRAGETLGVIGANGAGKSTLIGLLSGALRPSAGDIFLAGERLTGLPRERFARLGVGRTHQIPKPFSRMTVLENLMLPRLAARGGGYREAERDCAALLERTGLADAAETPAGDLTLLRLKRLELARALALRPRVLLLDEIGAGLIESELVELIGLIKELAGEVESILVVEHILDVITECADRVVVLDWGKKLTEGSPAEVLGDPQVAAAYLGTGSTAVSTRERAEQVAEPELLLVVDGVAARYGGFRALHDVSLSVVRGSVVTLLGANGAGKTTTARVISGMLAPSAGTVTFKGERIDGRRPHDVVRLGIAHCMEGRRIFADLSVDENLELGGQLAPSASQRRERRDGVYELFPILAAKRRDSGASLSGGQQQMLAIGRALMADPELVIFDEISLGLAPVVLEQLYEALAELNRRGTTMLVVEQNVERGLSLADHAYVLEKGVVALSGTASSVLGDPRLKALYVGEARGPAAPPDNS